MTPYGNTISSSGTLASANVYRFSSKELHVNSGLYYYGYRWYHPNLQRWLNRDPIQEWGGINLYAFVLNRPTHSLDPFGEQGTNDPNPKPFPLLSIPPGVPPIATPPKFEMPAPFPTPWPNHHASLDAGARAGIMCSTGPAARPQKPTRPCTTYLATTPKKPAGTEKKFCEGHGTITVSCTEHDSCEFHSQPLNAPTQYHWVTKRECPCPPPPESPGDPTPGPKPK
jgi:RHS repeat-associated protein